MNLPEPRHAPDRAPIGPLPVIFVLAHIMQPTESVR
jgi:hypothetical protein